ncbi:MAG: N-acetylmuramoyl-L-alanine amidase [Akkermansiaceae bacterium]|nr:N-acetylmuramoyl-L-alanine amidase [Akkermansiaceae bacterium]
MKVLLASILGILLASAVATNALAGDFTVVIDAGHGGKKYVGSQQARTLSSPNNATSPSGLKEKNLTLELALEVDKQVRALAKKYPGTRLNCILTRKTDENLDFATRASICTKASPAPTAIVSLHFNASDKHNALGSLCLVNHPGRNPNYRRDHAFADGLTKATSSAVKQFIPASFPRKPMTDQHLHGGVGSNFFYQLARHKHLQHTLRCFLEVEFIDRADIDNALLKKRQKTFPVIARAIAEYLYQHCQKQ